MSDQVEHCEALAKTAYDSIASDLTQDWTTIPFEQLPPELKAAWASVIVQTQILAKFPEVTEPIAAGGHLTTCAWEVTAGLIPGQPMPEFTKRWALTAEERRCEHAADIFSWRMIAAMQYALLLQNPQRLNWVRLDWVWF